MGGGRLFVVRGEFDVDQARVMAVHAAEVLDGRVGVDSLEQALAGCATVVGTTARRGAYRQRCEDIRPLVRSLVEAEARDSPSALVFGPEDRGLSNDEIALCHRLAFIPSAAEYVSLNLAQAVMVGLYEYRRARLDAARGTASGGEGPRDTVYAQPQRRRADAGELEAMLCALQEALLEIGFLSQDNPQHVMHSIRSVLGRAGLDDREARIFRGLARQISWYAAGGREVAMGKRERGDKLR